MKLKLDLTGKDAVFLSNCRRYSSGLEVLELFRNHPDKVPSKEQVTGAIDVYQHTYEGGVNGDRVNIAKRKMARKALTEIFEKVLHYLEAVAEEDDIPALIQAGFEVRRTTRRRAVTAPAAG